jgi:hypothetical protein
VLALGAAPSASATSVGRSAVPSASACAVSAKFVSTRIAGGKLSWVFEPLPGTTSSPSRCATLTRPFEVYVPSGSYSTLAKSNVYPVSITEPSPGAEIDLRLEAVRFKSGETRWLIADGADAYRVRRR